ncbi:MAG: phage virion morphogenesis protein [Magnetococcales bacterium]|nr:phage virion morphogenesis protein [Magnetococcales bacterium]
MVEIKIDERPILGLLKKLAAKGGDMTAPFREIAGVMADAVEENFDQQGRPPWTPLAAATIAARQKSGHWPGSILQVHGRLASSITSESDAFRAVVGSNVVYARIHHLGGMAGRGRKVKIPARPYLQLADEDEEEIMDILRRYLSGD